MTEQAVIWHEDSAIWEIISGELVVQHSGSLAGDESALATRAHERVAEVADLLRAGNKDSAGHALIGCALALGLAARAEAAEETPIDLYAAELAASVSWQSTEPGPEQADALALQLAAAADSGHAPGGGPSFWELAVQAGSYAAGLSPYITRRRERRDIAGS